ncbi:SLC35A4 upstream open reading frame protein-like [Phyllostomus discolor]|uniref:SLC35A4 upstream open reading frame protein-like n=1 Tax=Phyllostomus discolor TaxID=89673 RepID=A0A6J2N3F4_9CHIR|nr:SLC35A4 upstream open reading frame protein-like [Phyllostomus discolor]
MADDKDSLPKLKDLAFLKNQLERLQQRVEDEVSSGVGQNLEKVFGENTTAFQSKGEQVVGHCFLAGYVVAKLRASAVLGFAVGTCTGIYAAQAYAVPNVEKTLRDYLRSLRKGPG